MNILRSIRNWFRLPIMKLTRAHYDDLSREIYADLRLYKALVFSVNRAVNRAG